MKRHVVPAIGEGLLSEECDVHNNRYQFGAVIFEKPLQPRPHHRLRLVAGKSRLVMRHVTKAVRVCCYDPLHITTSLS